MIIDHHVYLWDYTFLWEQALHHPFTAPHPQDMEDLRNARALAYDLVYNGVEVCYNFLLNLPI